MCSSQITSQNGTCLTCRYSLIQVQHSFLTTHWQCGCSAVHRQHRSHAPRRPWAKQPLTNRTGYGSESQHHCFQHNTRLCLTVMTELCRYFFFLICGSKQKILFLTCAQRDFPRERGPHNEELMESLLNAFCTGCVSEDCDQEGWLTKDKYVKSF